jgi:hypothetical protein
MCSAAGKSAAKASPDEFTELQAQIAAHSKWNLPRLERETLRPEALILDSDQSPVDIVYRRTLALLNHLQSQPGAPDLSAEATALAALRPPAGEGVAQQREHFARLAALRRKIAFKNPLLDFDRIVFLKHDKMVRGERHMIDQYFGFNSAKTGGVYVLEQPFGDHPVVRSLLAGQRVPDGRLKGQALENAGGFISLDLDFDGRSLLFAFTEAEHELPRASRATRTTGRRRICGATAPTRSITSARRTVITSSSWARTARA